MGDDLDPRDERENLHRQRMEGARESDIEDAMFRQEAHDVAQAMQKYGRSFVQKLGEALQRADGENTAKIADTWPDLWKEYAAKSEDME